MVWWCVRWAVFSPLLSSLLLVVSHNPHSKKSARIMAIPNVGLCQRCHDIIEWRKKFRKYKPIKNMTKCMCCQEKKVRSAYHNWCTDCAKASNVCPKCLEVRDVVGAPVAPLSQESIQEMLVQVGMKERVRRKMWRLWENSKVTDEELRELIFSYNPDSKDEPDDEEEADDEQAARPSAAALAAARGPPPKPKAAAASSSASASAPAATPASAPAAAQPKPTSTSATTQKEENKDAEDEDEDDEDCDYLDDDSEDD